MERQEIIDGLIEVLKTVRMIEPEKLVGVTEETDFLANLNIPSSQMIAIVAKVEQKFDIEFEDDDIDGLGSTVKDVVDLILKVKARD
ncbi:phosphopantetheine-binding protein [Daejeonella sp. H1SJ63]|uniref:phosphopantetheine-binding protein n=1 Tax=Daejeonella sp. H1SJ63 TaxID=3034145 RepID=UPI0023EB24E0|nr:phosphopantetheine-binding protein [Daejeonella sp. H1SJ63]